MADLLLLAMGRLAHGLTIAGMTTEPDPVTRLRWVRPVTKDGLVPDDLRYDDGTLARPGDVIRVDLGEPQGQAPFVENVPLKGGLGPATRIRTLGGPKRSAFFTAHLDPDPRAVISRTPQRSLCLVQPEEPFATFMFDEETGKFEARLTVKIGTLKSGDAGIPVTDIYWRALGRQWLGDEPFGEFDAAHLHHELGDIFLVIALNSKGRPAIIGVHSVPDFHVELDEDNL